MNDNIEIFKIWAPDDALWTQWAKPVLFIHRPNIICNRLDIPELEWIQEMNKNTMIILDLPGKSGVTESLALARIGYRPVPLYNGVNSVSGSALIDVSDLAAALFRGAEVLKKLHIKPDAPPVFMLDSRRMKGIGRRSGTFDNRWCVFPQDMPSAMFLYKNGIYKVIIRSESIQNDLAHILRRYQEEGIRIYQCNGKEIKNIPVVKPSLYKSLSYRFFTILGLKRNAAGGFGKMVPEAADSAAGGYYRFG
ncbi:MAG: hypothetical protein GX022_03600 [Clostridiaceae bacterium]|nr:hypothetical protein [Clostridiaceae bacterium]